MENPEQAQKFYCTRCFSSIEPNDKVEVDGQSFHKMCSMCCVCRKIPSSLKMFYGHVFCSDCFQNHVISHFKGEAPKISSNSWWMRWNPQGQACRSQGSSEAPRSVCNRCLQVIEDKDSINIGDQAFHTHCARCYYCQTVPKSSVKVYYGQVFCEECFHKHVMPQNKDNPSEFFKSCFDQWQNNPQFADSMRDFMASSSSGSPFVFLMQDAASRCAGEAPTPSFQAEAKKSATTIFTEAPGSWEMDCDLDDSIRTTETNEKTLEITDKQKTVEKIAKLTKYLSASKEEHAKKWENVTKSEIKIEGWVDLQGGNKDVQRCPKCLWQCSSFYVKSSGKVICCGANVSE